MPKLTSASPGTRRASALAAAVAAAAILLLTLWPLGPKPGFADDRLSLRFGLADGLRNVLLFVPLGIALAGRGMGVLRGALCAALLSGGIELAQLWIPGRYANVSDLVGNVAGALLGAGVHASAPRWLRPGRRAAARLALGGSMLVSALLLGTGVLFGPALPATDYYAGRTPELGQFERYTGRVTSATLGAEPIGNGRLAHSAEVRRLWLSGATLRVEAVAGARTNSLAPILTLHDAARREIVVLGAERGDLLLRERTRAQALSLDRPALRWPGILDGVAEGEPLVIGARRDGHGWCLSLGQRSVCQVGFTVGSGWRLVWFPGALPPLLAQGLNDLWLALLFLPLGLWLRSGVPGVISAGLAVGALLVAPVAGLLPTPPAELAASLAGMALGAALRPLLAHRRDARRA